MSGLPNGSVDKESSCNAGVMGDRSLILESGRSSGGGQNNSLQYSCLENPMDRGAWQATVHRITKSWTQLKSLLMNVKEESEKVSLKLNIHKTKIMASSPITSWQIDVETVETVADFILLGSKITADIDSSHEIKKCLLPGEKVMTNLDSILKSRDITLSTKVRLVRLWFLQ